MSRDDLKREYARASDEELLEAHSEGASAYTPEAWSAIQAELAKRSPVGTSRRAGARHNPAAGTADSPKRWHQQLVKPRPVPSPLRRWIASLPQFWQPVANGAGLIVFLIIERVAFGGWVVLLFAFGAAVVHGTLSASLTVANAADFVAGFGIAIAGGACGGLAYSLLGKYLKSAPWIGPELAGTICVLPYLVAVMSIVQLTDPQPLTRSFLDWEAGSLLLLSGFFGSIIGYKFWRKPNRRLAQSGQARQPTSSRHSTR